MARTTYNVGKVLIQGNTMSDVTQAQFTMNGEDWSITAIGDANPSEDDITETFQLQITANYNASNAAQALLLNKFMGGSRNLTSAAYYADATKYFSGSGLISSCNITKSVGGFDQLQATIKSSGTWSYT